MKKILIGLLLGFMVFMAGCSSGSSGKTSGFSINTFNGGDNALSYEFDENMPPQSIRDQGIGSFAVRLILENTGEFDIPADKTNVVLTGFNPQDLNLDDSSKSALAMNGIKKQGSRTIPGGKSFVIFNNLKYMGDITSGTLPLKINADICFPYETKSIIKACITGNTLSSIDEDLEICSVSSKLDFANSGGPIQIDNVEQYPAGESSIQIQFDIVHKPQSSLSRVYQKDSFDENCKIDGNTVKNDLDSSKKDTVTYIVESGISGLDCGGSGTNTQTVILSGDMTTITCVQDTSGQEDYEKPIKISLAYDYYDRISKTIEIEHIAR